MKYLTMDIREISLLYVQLYAIVKVGSAHRGGQIPRDLGKIPLETAQKIRVHICLWHDLIPAPA
jgi:hypothetical protein